MLYVLRTVLPFAIVCLLVGVIVIYKRLSDKRNKILKEARFDLILFKLAVKHTPSRATKWASYGRAKDVLAKAKDSYKWACGGNIFNTKARLAQFRTHLKDGMALLITAHKQAGI